MRAQNVSLMCLVCGVENPFGLHTRFFELEGDEVAAAFAARQEHQGYPGRLHGGVVSAVLDETIGRAISIAEPDVWGVTVELTVKLRRPVPASTELIALGRITKDTTRVFEGSGEILLPSGVVAAEARGRYMKLPIERIADADFHRNWFADTGPLPAAIEIPQAPTAG